MTAGITDRCKTKKTY